MKPFIAKFQIGKNGLTKEFVDSVLLAFENRKQIRISVLKSCTRDREKIKGIIRELKTKLPAKCNCKLIGFTIVLIK